MDYLDFIAEIIKEHLKIDVIKDNSRRINVIDAKKIFCELARELTLYSYADIGMYINKNHATVIHLRKCSQNLREFDKDYLKKYNICLYHVNKNPMPVDECIEKAYKYHLQKVRFYKRILNKI